MFVLYELGFYWDVFFSLFLFYVRGSDNLSVFRGGDDVEKGLEMGFDKE